MHAPLALIVEAGQAGTRLVSPEVGTFTGALPRGTPVVPGAPAGVLVQLGVRRRLVIPDGVAGSIANDPFERVHQPVGYGDLVYEVEPERARTAAGARKPAARSADAAAGLVLRARTSGRFWARPTPAEPPFVSPGAVVRDGQPVGLIEVMKTFGHAVYRAGDGLPPVARVVAVLVADGADVRQGDPLLSVEPAGGER